MAVCVNKTCLSFCWRRLWLQCSIVSSQCLIVSWECSIVSWQSLSSLFLIIVFTTVFLIFLLPSCLSSWAEWTQFPRQCHPFLSEEQQLQDSKPQEWQKSGNLVMQKNTSWQSMFHLSLLLVKVSGVEHQLSSRAFFYETGSYFTQPVTVPSLPRTPKVSDQSQNPGCGWT